MNGRMGARFRTLAGSKYPLTCCRLFRLREATVKQDIKTDVLTAIVRHCWVRKDRPSLSCETEGAWQEPTWRAIVIEFIFVNPKHWRQGHCRRFIEMVRDDNHFELAIVEAVQNPHLYDALLRWGWELDYKLNDFYWLKKGNVNDRQPDTATTTGGGSPPQGERGSVFAAASG